MQLHLDEAGVILIHTAFITTISNKAVVTLPITDIAYCDILSSILYTDFLVFHTEEGIGAVIICSGIVWQQVNLQVISCAENILESIHGLVGRPNLQGRWP